MAAAANKHKIQAVPNWVTGAWVPVTCPISECRGFAVTNMDGSNVLQVCTDPTDSTSVLNIAAGGAYSTFFQGYAAHHAGFAYGDVICYVKGAGSQPVASYVA